MVEDGYSCTLSPSDCIPVCRDGKVIGDEICDDFSIEIPGIKCKDDCSGPEEGWICDSGSAFFPSTCYIECGDGVILSPEECDDGDKEDLDGCDSDCLIEQGFNCIN